MVRATAKSGRRAGQPLSRCSDFGCPTLINIDETDEAPVAPVAGESTQARFERDRAEHREQLKTAAPILIALGVLLSALGFYTTSSFLDVRAAALVGVLKAHLYACEYHLGRAPRNVPGLPRSPRYAPRMSNLIDIVDAPPLQVWGEAVRARRVQGERITLAVVELAPNAEVPEHRHDAEQLGMVIRGEVRFRLDGETRILAPGGTWRITSNRPHQVSAGPDGAVVIDVFTPVRSDWDSLPVIDGATPRWPDGG